MSRRCPGCHKIYGCCKDAADYIPITYASVADINYTWHPQTFYGKFKQFDLTRTLYIFGGCHKDVTAGTDLFTDEKYDVNDFPYLATCHDPAVHLAMCNWGLRDVLLLSANSRVGTFRVVPCTNLRG